MPEVMTTMTVNWTIHIAVQVPQPGNKGERILHALNAHRMQRCYRKRTKALKKVDQLCLSVKEVKDFWSPKKTYPYGLCTAVCDVWEGTPREY